MIIGKFILTASPFQCVLFWSIVFLIISLLILSMILTDIWFNNSKHFDSFIDSISMMDPESERRKDE